MFPVSYNLIFITVLASSIGFSVLLQLLLQRDFIKCLGLYIFVHF